MNEDNRKIRDKLRELITAIEGTTSEGKSPDSFQGLEMGKDGVLNISYSYSDKGLNNASRLLEKLKSVYFIDNIDLPYTNPIPNITNILIRSLKCYLKTEVVNDSLQITFKPKFLAAVILDKLDLAISKTREVSRNGSFINVGNEEPLIHLQSVPPEKIKILPELSYDVVKVQEYLKEKVEAAFPNGNVKATYSAANPDDGKLASFMLIFDYKHGHDYSAFKNFKAEVLDKIFPETSTSMFRVNEKDSEIGLKVSGSPSILLEMIGRYNKKNAPQMEPQPAVASI